MASWKLGPALAAGNSVILKPAEQSPLTAIRIAELAAEAGLPDGVLNVLPGFGETAGQALGRHMDVDMVAFTGSTEVGKYFLRYSGESNMKHISLESRRQVAQHRLRRRSRSGRSCPGGAAAFSTILARSAPRATRAHRRGEDQGRVRRARRQASPRIGRPQIPSIPRPPWARWSTKTRWIACSDYIDIGRKEGAKSLAAAGGHARESTGGYYIEPTIFDAVENQHADRPGRDFRAGL